jgi:hypothetical protein
MPISRITARKLATAQEWTLLESSYQPLLKEITPARLAQRIARARKLEQKYQTAAAEVRRKARSGAGDGPDVGSDADRKQALFGEARERFVGQLGRIEAKAAKARKGAVPRPGAGTVGEALANAARNGLETEQARMESLLTASKAESEQSRGPRMARNANWQGASAHMAHAGEQGRPGGVKQSKR